MMFNFKKTALANFCVMILLCRRFISLIFCCNKSTTNEFKKLLLTEEAHVRIILRKSSIRPNKASRKTYRKQCAKQKSSNFNFNEHFINC